MKESGKILNDRFYADCTEFLKELEKNADFATKLNSHPSQILKDYFGSPEIFLKRYYNPNATLDTEAGIKELNESLHKVFSLELPLAPGGEVSISITGLAFVGLAYAASAYAAKLDWSPFAYSDQNLFLTDEKIKELLDKGIITQSDVMGKGHKGI